MNNFDDFRKSLEASFNNLLKSIARNLRKAIDENNEVEIKRIIALLENGLDKD